MPARVSRPMTAITTTELTKDFFTGFWRPVPKRALDGLSLVVPTGGVFGLLGPNGAGKSTTLKLLMGLIRPTRGTAELLGAPPGDTASRRRLGFLPENPTFYDHLTAEELLTYFAGLFGFRGEDRRRRVARVLDQVGLTADRRRPIRQYSKGMVQRVGLASALVNDPELVVLDEPMSGLDPIGRRDVRTMVAELGAEGRTVVFSSHILTDAEELCERVAILARGRLVTSGRIAELTAGHVTGWRVTMTGGDDARVEQAAPAGRIRRLADGRFAIDLNGGERPEPLIGALAAAGARLESVAPRRETLEDVFVRALEPDTAGAPVPSGGREEVAAR